MTPHSAAAQVNVPIGGTPRGSSQYPYAGAGAGGYDDGGYGQPQAQQPYGRISPMVPAAGTAPPAVSNVRAHAGDVGVSRDNAYNGQDLDEPAPKNSLWRILTCRCG